MFGWESYAPFWSCEGFTWTLSLFTTFREVSLYFPLLSRWFYTSTRYVLSQWFHILLSCVFCLSSWTKKKSSIISRDGKMSLPHLPCRYARTHAHTYPITIAKTLLSLLVLSLLPLPLLSYSSLLPLAKKCLPPASTQPKFSLPPPPLLYNFFSLLVFPILKKGRGGDRAPMIWLCITNPNYIIPSQDWLIKHCYLFDFL